MNFRHIQTLLQQPKTTTHLLQIHSFILKTALDHHEFIISNFILASSSISIDFARLFFDNSPVIPPLFAWNTIIKGYSKSPTPLESVRLHNQLQRTTDLKPDKFTYPFVLKSCGRCSMLATACGNVGFAGQVFDEMSQRDVVSWSSMIAGYVTCNYPLNALSVFLDMKQAKEKPNSVTLVSLLSVCSHLVNIKMGESIHAYILTNDIRLDVSLLTALIGMYATCGYIEKAMVIFNSMKERNLQSWTIMISGLAENGRGEEAISLFNEMEKVGLIPDAMSFSGILSACSHMGLVEKGREYFDRMVKCYKVKPTMEHYGCMVDMFGRAGMIEEAYDVLRNMPMEPNSIMLRSFMSAYKNHGISRSSFDENLMKLLLKIEPEVGANYILSATVSSVSGYWSDVDDMRVAMKGIGLKKVPGCSWVQVKGV
ncbi:pentatricopeptide repeat-containing protein At4g21065-like isoform X2 [Cynara cardunculus var. scolymus]|uniref:pentatricopeptide repeat-containing protein At4g21065-like isoform X2 n=1 Tax=Cynara cardunculus var. scolymus TaxID=59895 RepID=UPI000D62BAC3|nr:pentatricopeptide repeat-containing protein At4g21065-like isoform X2 [Cynara cardunculus var. scolymus]